MTPVFVSVAGWKEAVRTICEHVDFSRRLNTVLTIRGEAGVGKTRCTYEALAGLPGYEALVVYTSDEKLALEMAHVIARDPSAQAILVADECSLEIRDRLRQLLPGCTDRLRVIAIDNNLPRAGGAGEVPLVRITSHEVDTILARNYADISSDRRHIYARLAGGFVRIAVDLCLHDSLISPDGRTDTVSGFFYDYYLQRRLQTDGINAVLLISLLSRVGYRDDVAAELESLCGHPRIGLRPAEVILIAQRLRQSPGFIAFGGRYLYVTPHPIAHVAFESAWERWITADPSGFFCELHESLIEPFLARVRDVGSDAMRQAVSDFFLRWAGQQGPPDLGREYAVVRLVRLVETQPETMLPLLCGLVESCPIDELRRIHTGDEAQQPRRRLVWLAEKMTHFPEFFGQAERILLRLALAETEPHLGNNASRVWAALFRIELSGVAVPFQTRLELLEERLRTTDPAQSALGLEALDEILFDGPMSHLAMAPVLFGRLPPPEWRPSGAGEQRACRSAALEMVTRLAVVGGPVADGVRRVVVNRLSPLLRSGHLGEARTALGEERLPDLLLTAVIRELEQFFDFYCKDHRRSVDHSAAGNGADRNGKQFENEVGAQSQSVGSDMERQVREWYHSLIPQDLHGRLVGAIGQDFWHQQLQGDRNTRQLRFPSP